MFGVHIVCQYNNAYFHRYFCFSDGTFSQMVIRNPYNIGEGPQLATDATSYLVAATQTSSLAVWTEFAIITRGVEDDDEHDDVGLKEKPEDTRYIKKITSK